MLSLDNCRDLLGCDGEELDAADLESIRDQLYSVARLTLERSPTSSGQESTFKDALTFFPQLERESIEERAAVIEFEGKLRREVAEKSAISQAMQDWNN
jgi:hypothetical protein